MNFAQAQELLRLLERVAEALEAANKAKGWNQQGCIMHDTDEECRQEPHECRF